MNAVSMIQSIQGLNFRNNVSTSFKEVTIEHPPHLCEIDRKRPKRCLTLLLSIF